MGWIELCRSIVEQDVATITLSHGIDRVKIGCLSDCGLGHDILTSRLALVWCLVILRRVLDLKDNFHRHASLLADPHLTWIDLRSLEWNKAWSG
jgi:hypothetical protein